MIRALLSAGLLIAGAATADEPVTRADGVGIVEASFGMASDIYPHRVLGPIREKLQLTARDETGATYRVTLSQDGPDTVFEDIAPRLADMDGDGRLDVVVIEADVQLGGMLAVYALRDGALERIATTRPIGRAFRWLAPAGIADFNGDGRNDVAYVETPHLGKVLKIVTLEGDQLVELAAAPGYSNHRIGEDFISGGVRDCGQGPEAIVADGSWRRVMAARLDGGRIVARDLGPFEGARSFEAALRC